MRLILLLLSVVLGSAFAFTVDLNQFTQHWNSYKVKYSKKYESVDEELRRMSVYLENKKKIEEHNRKYEEGLVTYKAGLNHLSDKTSEEVARIMNGLDMTAMLTSPIKPSGTFVAPSDVEIPLELDWRAAGAVTEVKDQGECGACWAFATTGSLEGQIFIKTNQLIPLSAQNLLDCTPTSNGCRGGLMDFAFEYIKNNTGVDSEELYPYEGVRNFCRYSAAAKAASDTGFEIIATGDEDALMKAVAIKGPVSAGIRTPESFTNYQDRVYYDPDCIDVKWSLNHAVLVVGYGVDVENGTEVPYWLVKNSQGTQFGKDGYIKMARNRDNHCGIATHAVYPKL